MNVIQQEGLLWECRLKLVNKQSRPDMSCINDYKANKYFSCGIEQFSSRNGEESVKSELPDHLVDQWAI